jgi:purine catabolism regulator
MAGGGVAEGPWTVPVRDLLALPELGMRVRAGQDVLDRGLDRPVSWATVSELVDPTEFLRGGELLLLVGVSLPAGAQAQRTYVRRLADAGVAAVGFGVGLYWDDVPPALVTAAERAGLPLLEVPRSVPFLAISRAVAQAIGRRERAAGERLASAQRALTAAAVGRGGPAAVLDEVRRLTGGWALLLNSGGAVLAASPPEAAGHRAALDADLARLREAPGVASLVSSGGGPGGRRGSGGVGVPAEWAGQTWVQSLGAGAEVLGYLAVGRDPALSADERAVVNAAVPLCTLSLDRTRAVGRGARRVRAGALRLLLAGQAELVRSVAGELWNGLPDEPVVLAECRGVRFALAAARDRLAADRRTSAERVLHAELDDTLVCLAHADGPDVDRLLAVLRGVEGLRIGLSDPTGYSGLDRARDQARRAADHGTGPGTRVTRFAEVPRLGLAELVALLPPEATEEFVASVLRPLREDAAGPADRREELLRSLTVWLAHHGQWDPAAAELGVHRHTLRNRVRKVERLLGRELDSADLRAELWLALRLEQRSDRRAGH